MRRAAGSAEAAAVLRELPVVREARPLHDEAVHQRVHQLPAQREAVDAAEALDKHHATATEQPQLEQPHGHDDRQTRARTVAQHLTSGTAQAEWQSSDEEPVVDGDDEMTEEQALEMEAALECVSLRPVVEAAPCCMQFGNRPCVAHHGHSAASIPL